MTSIENRLKKINSIVNKTKTNEKTEIEIKKSDDYKSVIKKIKKLFPDKLDRYTEIMPSDLETGMVIRYVNPDMDKISGGIVKKIAFKTSITTQFTDIDYIIISTDTRTWKINPKKYYLFCLERGMGKSMFSASDMLREALIKYMEKINKKTNNKE
jgi:hypothetical protein